MATKILRQLDGGLTPIPGEVVTGDTVQNLTLGLLTIVKCKEETIGASKVVREVPGSEITVAPGKVSAVLTFADGEDYYLKNTDGGMGSTIPKVIV